MTYGETVAVLLGTIVVLVWGVCGLGIWYWRTHR